MSKALKTTAKTIGVLLILAFTAIVAFISLLNPNNYKPQLSQLVEQKTGRQLILQGDLKWSLYPWLGLTAHNATLSNAPGFGKQPFAQVKGMAIKVEFLPLLKRQVKMGNIVVDGLELNLMKNSDGVTNWQDLAAHTAGNPAKKPAPGTTSSAAQPLALAVAGVDVINGHVTWTDQQSGQSYDISQLQLKSQTLQLGQTFPIDLKFVVQSKKPALQADLHFTGTVAVSADKKFTVQGQLQSKSLQWDALKITELNTTIKAQDGLVTLQPITAQLYQGTYSGNLILDTRKPTLLITTDADLANIAVEPLLHDLNSTSTSRLQISGTGHAKAHLNVNGPDTKAISGQVQFAVNNGLIKGIDIPYWISVGKALVNKQTPPAQAPGNQTSFGDLTGTFVINNGHVENKDLLLQAHGLQVKGNGTINLTAQTLDYHLTAQATHPDTNQPDSVAVPIRIQGAMSSPNIQPDIDSLLKNQVKQKISQVLDQHAKDLIDQHVGKDLGDKLKNQLNGLFKQ